MSKKKKSPRSKESPTDVEKRLDENITAQAERFRESDEARQEVKAQFIRDNVSPPGSFPNMPPLLEARRLLYNIPDGFFFAQACNDRINVFQIQQGGDDGETYGGKDGIIAKPDWVQQRAHEQAPQGIIVSAGLQAMDQMYANGFWIGHVVSFVRMSPWRKPVEVVGSKPAHVMIMSAGDICDSDDLCTSIRSGTAKYVRRDWKLDDGATAHEYFLQDTKTGKIWDPSLVEMTEEEANAE